MRLSSLIAKAAFCAALILSGFSAEARQTSSQFLLELSPPNGNINQKGYFGIQILNGNVLSYDISTGQVSFGTIDQVIQNGVPDNDLIFADRFEISQSQTQDRSGLYNPLFCFDLLGTTGPTLSAIDANGYTVIDEFHTGLSYDVADSRFDVVAPADTACFYRAYDVDADLYGDFGLFGEAPISGDVGITYDVPVSVAQGGVLTYERVITNNSNDRAMDVEFQEVFPANPAFFTTASFVDAEAEVRGTVLGLAAGDSDTAQVTRQLAPGAVAGQFIDLYFAAAERNSSGGAISAASAHQRVLVTAADADQSTVSATPTSGVVADGTAASTITVTVRDPDGALVGGQAVTLAVTGGSGSLGSSSLVTGTNGEAQTSLTSTTAGTVEVSAYLGSSSADPLAGTVSVGFVAGSASQISVNAGDNQTATVSTSVATAPSVLVTDANGNPVQGVSVTFAVASGGGSLSPTTAVTTGANGVASVSSWTLGLGAGENTLTATGSGLTGSPVTFTATGTAGAAAQIAISAGDGQTAVAGTAVSTPPSVLVTDASGNPVEGASVVFAVESGGGSVAPTTAVTTGSDGIAAVTSWTLGTTAGANSLTATSIGLTGSPATFTATGEAGVATQLVFTSSEADLQVGESRTLTVEVQDVNGNLVSSAGGIVEFRATFSSGPFISPLDGVTALPESVVGGQASLEVGGVSAGPVTIFVEDVSSILSLDTTTFSVVDP